MTPRHVDQGVGCRNTDPTLYLCIPGGRAAGFLSGYVILFQEFRKCLVAKVTAAAVMANCLNSEGSMLLGDLTQPFLDRFCAV